MEGNSLGQLVCKARGLVSYAFRFIGYLRALGVSGAGVWSKVCQVLDAAMASAFRALQSTGVTSVFGAWGKLAAFIGSLWSACTSAIGIIGSKASSVSGAWSSLVASKASGLLASLLSVLTTVTRSLMDAGAHFA